MTANNIEIRPLTTVAEIKKVEALEKAVWQMADVELMPAHLLHALVHNGSSLLGAFDGEELIGFVFSVLGTVTDEARIDRIAAARLKMYSVAAGVHPDYQGQGIGYRLKLAQREEALQLGIRLITWTYDPLESRNGRFNISKLGTICRTYKRNFHGELGGINAGLATDRFEVEWWVTGNRADARVVRERRPLSLDAFISGGALLVNEATFNNAGLPVPPPNYISSPSMLFLVEIPADFQTIKEKDFDLALRWREHTRQLFTALFQSGYVVTDFVHDPDVAGNARSFYLLTHQVTEG